MGDTIGLERLEPLEIEIRQGETSGGRVTIQHRKKIPADSLADIHGSG